MGWVRDDILGVPRSNIEGVDRTMAEINRRLTRMVNYGSLKGLLKAVALVRRDMDRVYPKIPVDYGNLRASFFAVSSSGKIAMGGGKEHSATGNTGNFSGPKASQLASDHASMLSEMQPIVKGLSKTFGGPFVAFGFSANYAMYVHEMWDPEVHWKRKQSGPGFFVVPLERNKHKMFQAVRDNSRIT